MLIRVLEGLYYLLSCVICMGGWYFWTYRSRQMVNSGRLKSGKKLLTLTMFIFTLSWTLLFGCMILAEYILGLRGNSFDITSIFLLAFILGIVNFIYNKLLLKKIE